MAFKFNEDTIKTLSETFNVVKDKTWHGVREEYAIATTKEFSKVLGECMGEAVSAHGSKLSFGISSDDELAKAACDIMKKRLGL